MIVIADGPAAARALRIVTESARTQVLMLRSHPMVPLATIVQPAVFLIILLNRPGARQPPHDVATVVGVMLISLWGATLWTGGGTLRREVAEGTLARGLTGIADPRLIIGGKCMGSTLLVLTLLTGTSAVALVVTGTALQMSGVFWLALGFALVAASGTAMGFVLCSVFVLTRYAVQVTAALVYPVYIASGIILPLRLFPEPLVLISHLFSLYWADEFLSQAAAGDFGFRPLLFLVLLTAGYFWTGSLLLTRVIAQARQAGTIDLG